MFESYLARQPIFDVNEQLIGYELLYRNDHGEKSTSDGEQATTEVFINSCIDAGLAKLVGHHQAFINVTRDVIINHEQLLPPNQPLVLELLENVVADDEVSTAVKSLINKGYSIALDGFGFDNKHRGLIQLAHIVKIDILNINAGELTKLVASLRSFPVKLLAEKVETIAQYDHCRKLGFDYYQGRFLYKPRIMRDRRLPANKLHVMQLLAELQKNDADAKELEKIIEQDVALSYKLLRFINSATFSLRRKIESTRQAVVIIGQDETRKWASMISLSGIEGKSSELIRVALLRAKMCELLTEASGQGNQGSAFMIGLFSTLDALMDTPLNELLSMLPISDDIKDALLYHRGSYNNALNCTLCYEKGDWKSIEDTGFSDATVIACYLQAVEWSNESSVQLVA